MVRHRIGKLAAEDCQFNKDLPTMVKIQDEIEPLESLRDEEKWKFAIESYKEAVGNVRHFHNTAFRVATWGTTSLALFAGWLLKEQELTSFSERLGLILLAVGFVGALLIVQRNCSRLTRESYLVIIQVDKAFACFTKDAYLPGVPLFPRRWSRLGRTPFAKRLSTSLMSPLIIGLIIVHAIIVLR